MPDPVYLRQRLRESLRVAMNARDPIAAAAFRSAMSAVDNAEAVDGAQAPRPAHGIVGDVRLGVGAGEVARRDLSTLDVLEVFRVEIRDRIAAAAEYQSRGRAAQATRLKAEATALESFLETVLNETR